MDPEFRIRVRKGAGELLLAGSSCLTRGNIVGSPMRRDASGRMLNKNWMEEDRWMYLRSGFWPGSGKII